MPGSTTPTHDQEGCKLFIDTVADSITVVPRDRDVADHGLEPLAAFAVAGVGDALGRLGLMHSRIRQMTPGRRCAGRALTVWTREGDNLAIHRALDEARPGDVLVVNAMGEITRAVFGDLLAEIALASGLAGVVIDSAIRDLEPIRRTRLPVWSAAVTPAGPTKHGPGQVGVAIACGGVVVSPGDYVTADDDGVAMVPRDQVEGVLERLSEIEAFEGALRERIRETRTTL